MYLPFSTVCGWAWLGAEGLCPEALRVVGAGGGVSEVLGAGGLAGRKGGCVAGPAWEQPGAGSRLSSLGHAIGSKFIYPIACVVCQGRAGEACLPARPAPAGLGRGGGEATLWRLCFCGKRCGEAGWGVYGVVLLLKMMVVVVVTANSASWSAPAARGVGGCGGEGRHAASRRCGKDFSPLVLGLGVGVGHPAWGGREENGCSALPWMWCWGRRGVVGMSGV